MCQVRGELAPQPAQGVRHGRIEETDEFLSAERIEKMPILFQQPARIAKRGRKRWLGLVFVTQLLQHLPRQVFGLVNSYILHKTTDRATVPCVDGGADCPRGAQSGRCLKAAARAL